VEVWLHRVPEAYCWSENVEIWSAVDALQACRRGGIEVWSSGAMEARYWSVDMEVWRYRALQL